MFRHILVATDGSPLSREAAIHAIHMARSLHAKLTAMTVVRGFGQVFGVGGIEAPASESLKEAFEERRHKRANAILDEVKKAAAHYGVQCFSAVVFGDSPYRAIIEQADKLQCDLVVMASHGRTALTGVLLGSETQKVLTYSKIPVLVCRSGSPSK
jgi:nucleotide-binding universal stress UspA family protein